ncbi:hypothetical protein [Staphylococcus caprae]|uniref:hypothetical protein n=1 Tax=Staphylococcus caprae TaxID=29380 RepID=UPI001451937C|nr:hypothetical protein [Staphylococcus caprae]QJE26667.1 hypothetical protein HHJ99_12925 [Staphylococcus caprae]
MGQQKIITIEQYQRKKMLKTLLSRINQPLPPKTTAFMMYELNSQEFHLCCHNLYQAINQYLLIQRKYNPYFTFNVEAIDEWIVWGYQLVLEFLHDGQFIYDKEKYNLIQLTTHLFEVGSKYSMKSLDQYERQMLFQKLMYENIR